MFKKIIRVIRYRFFLFAGIFPYLLGQVIAYHTQKNLNAWYFWLGFLGILLVLVGVELFNEYFDAKEGGDRIFLLEKPGLPNYFLALGLLVFLLAFFIGLYFSFQVGLPILLFCLLGFLGAYFYLGPPLRWAYRGFGELVISLCYGPFMILGSYYLQTGEFELRLIFVSLVCGLSIFSLTLLNELPDYYQDVLVGKRNLVVRLGRKRAQRLFSLSYWAVFIILACGIALGKIPVLAGFVFFLFPWVIKSLKSVERNYDYPKRLLSAINTNVILYLMIVFFLGIGYLGK